ncbi:hypothetical protein MJO28_014109 [Puccinia striiformis f. sp. tritici]|uniref:Uncharacterized protein n=1 Tax=Puccinia striiformis f. sp. tritici TaxID=168172 RepID=A0ACC0DWD4_9BASI|nr:hypothetical protein MJO28_014109 [Puccinia striiformis f. sp. tritici]
MNKGPVVLEGRLVVGSLGPVRLKQAGNLLRCLRPGRVMTGGHNGKFNCVSIDNPLVQEKT